MLSKSDIIHKLFSFLKKSYLYVPEKFMTARNIVSIGVVKYCTVFACLTL